MAGTNLDIKIIAEFLGKTAFKQAETATNKLNKTVKSLGSSFGVAFGGAALGLAVRSAVKEFADAERETIALTNTVKNLGLAFDAPAVSNYVDQIGKLYGVTGAQAVPAMQALLSATGSVSKSTEIMNVALDLAASRNADVAAVASDLANAYVGNSKGLATYRLGLTKAELSAMTFDEILEKIATDTLGAADEAAASLSGKMAILSEAVNQAQGRIGGGLVDALGGLAGPNGAGGAAQTIENLSTKLTNAITGFGYLVQEVKIAQPILVGAGIAIGLAWAPWFTAISVAALAVGALGNALKKNNAIPAPNMGPLFFPGSGDGGYKEREKARKKAEQEALLRNKKLAQAIKDQAKAATDLLKKKMLTNAIDKANLLLGKSEKVFDIEAIQYNAALINQADQLGKTTNAAQMLAIANDVARLNVKRSMYELEQAIQSGDIVAIENATKKLNEDLKILGVLTGQKATIYDIKSILDSLKPKDLVDLTNLDAALAKIAEMLRLLAQANALAKAPIPTSASLGSGISSGDYIAPIPMSVGLSASTAALIEASEAIQARADAFSMLLDLQTEADTAALAASSLGAAALSTFNLEDVARSSLLRGLSGGAGVAGAVSGSRYAAQAANYYNITVNAAAVGSEEALVTAIQEGLQTIYRRGDSTTTAGAL
jgi:hypothetical protein